MLLHAFFRRPVSTLFVTALAFASGCATDQGSEASFSVAIVPNDYMGLCDLNLSGEFKPCQELTVTTAGSYRLRVGTLAQIPFTVDEAGFVTLAMGYDNVSAVGGYRRLSLKTVEIVIDPVDYQGNWRISRVRDHETRDPEELSGRDTVALVPSEGANFDKTIGAQYRLSVGIDSSEVIFSLRDNGEVTFTPGNNSTESMRVVRPGVVRFNNVHLAFFDAQEMGTKWQVNQVTPKLSDSRSRVGFVPGIEYQLIANDDNELFEVDRQCQVEDENDRPPPFDMNDVFFDVQCDLEGPDLFGNERLYVSVEGVALPDTVGVRVIKFDGSLLGTISHKDMINPRASAFDYERNHLLVANGSEGSVFIFNQKGRLVGQIPPLGGDTVAGDLAVDQKGRRFVVANEGKINVYGRDNAYLTTLEKSSDFCNQNSPITITDEYLYAIGNPGTSARWHRWKLSNLKYAGSFGNDEEQIINPQSVDVLSNGQFVVGGFGSEDLRNEISINLFSAEGVFLKTIVSGLRPVRSSQIVIDVSDHVWFFRREDGSVDNFLYMVRVDTTGMVVDEPIFSPGIGPTTAITLFEQ